MPDPSPDPTTSHEVLAIDAENASQEAPVLQSPTTVEFGDMDFELIEAPDGLEEGYVVTVRIGGATTSWGAGRWRTFCAAIAQATAAQEENEKLREALRKGWTLAQYEYDQGKDT